MFCGLPIVATKAETLVVANLMPADSAITNFWSIQLTTATIRITNTPAVLADTPKTPRPRPPAKALNRSKYGEQTVMRRLPVSILPAVDKLLARRLADVASGDEDEDEDEWWVK